MDAMSREEVARGLELRKLLMRRLSPDRDRAMRAAAKAVVNVAGAAKSVYPEMLLRMREAGEV